MSQYQQIVILQTSSLIRLLPYSFYTWLIDSLFEYSLYLTCRSQLNVKTNCNIVYISSIFHNFNRHSLLDVYYQQVFSIHFFETLNLKLDQFLTQKSMVWKQKWIHFTSGNLKFWSYLLFDSIEGEFDNILTFFFIFFMLKIALERIPRSS